MLKKIVLLMMVVCVSASMLAGCGKSKEEQQTEGEYDYSSIETDENGISSVEGIMSDKKDFMFILEDKTGAPYAFSFDKKPDNYDKFNDGDRIVVEFTGEISETEAFSGEIVSIKWK